MKKRNNPLVFSLITIFIMNSAYSQENGLGEKLSQGLETVKKETSKLKENVKKELSKNQERRAQKNWGLHFNYTYFDTWIPGKMGANAYYIESSESTWDLEYLKGSIGIPSFVIDIGEFSDTRISFLKRSFGEKSSFHYLYGVYYNNINVHLGDKFLKEMTGDSRYSSDLIDIKVAGLTWGIGNRWQTSGKFTWGVDWFTVNLPLVRLGTDTPYLDNSEDEDKKDDVRGVIEIFEKYPTFSILKLQLGISW